MEDRSGIVDISIQKSAFFENGWCKFPYSERLAGWVERSLSAARAAVVAPEFQKWMRCGGTWFAGVNALANDKHGAVADGPSLAGPAVDFIRHALAIDEIHWDRGQVSVCYPDYPQPMPHESETAFAYRRNRAAAHVDGVLPEGPERRRHLRQHHAFVLGIPMVEVSSDASPFTIWQGSHELVRQAFEERFQHLAMRKWGDEDITDSYQAMRRGIFKKCERVEVTAIPGEAYLVHRLALHGIAPWRNNAAAGEDGRMICYFRPEMNDGKTWISNP
jgi:hypothetical protein